MRWEEFIRLVGNLPVIDAEILLAGVSDSRPVKVQISRWHKTGKLIQVKKGIYLLGASYRKVDVYGPHLASVLKKPSYLSLEKALEYHGLIPEAVPVWTSVTTKRPGKFVSEAGIFDYRHLKNSLFWGYGSVTVNKQTAFIASPEKALLDLSYLKAPKVSFEYLEELRLQNFERINLDKLLQHGKRFDKPNILRTAEMIKEFINIRKKEEKTL
ncbi:hypothetical protein LR007_03170 [candidate division NPL-UPA2 bacterium]|nr:hypothetical protein [candidate division NPL-UPA2 bacterium]